MPQKKGCLPWNKNMKMSKTHCEKLSKSHQGQIAWNRGLKGICLTSRCEKCGAFLSDNHICKSVWNKGLTKEKSEIIGLYAKKQKITKAKQPDKYRGKNHGMFGKKQTNESKRKMRVAKLGNHYPKMSECKRGKKLSDSTKKKMSESAHKGCESNLWKGGISFEPYDKKFNNVFKRIIRKRDNQICMLCGTHREKLKEALHIHHINYDKKLTLPQNCISLCRSCHAKTGQNRTHWTVFFQSLLSERYKYQYENQKVVLRVKE